MTCSGSGSMGIPISAEFSWATIGSVIPSSAAVDTPYPPTDEPSPRSSFDPARGDRFEGSGSSPMTRATGVER